MLIFPVSARARQLVHRLKNRRAAILARREAEGDTPRNVLKSNDSSMPTSPAFDHNGSLATQPPAPPKAPVPHTNSPSMPSSGFTAVNNRHSLSSAELNPFHLPRESPQQREPHHHHHHHEPPPPLNGTPSQAPSHPLVQQVPEPPKTAPPPASETPTQTQTQTQPQTQVPTPSWMDKFLTPSERAAGMTADTVRRDTLPSMYRTPSRGEAIPQSEESLRLSSMSARRQETRRQSDSQLPEKPASSVSSDPQGPSVPIPNTPASLMPQQKPHTWNRDDGGPYKAEMISRMETMKRGERVIPPCDRCRRLHMDCIKNLTACLGCTKKHAKCSWKDVSLEELDSTAPAARERAEKDGDPAVPSSSEWDNMLKKTKTESSDHDRHSSVPPPQQQPNREVPPNKASTPRIASPPQVQTQAQNGTLNVQETNNRPAESPRLDVRPPPLDQQLRDAAEDRPHPMSPFARYSPFGRPLSRQHPPHSERKDEPMADGGDRLAAIASQVYRTASQNTNRTHEGRATETAS